MANHAPRLPYASFSGVVPDISLSEDDWSELEGVLEKSIPTNARVELLSLVKSYFENKRGEDSAETYTDAFRVLEGMERQAKALWDLAFPARAMSDAASKVEHDFARHLQDLPISVRAGSLQINSIETGAEHEIPEDEFRLRYRLRWSDVGEIAINITSALERLRQEYDSEVAEKPKHFQPGSAFVRFGLHVRKWAVQNDLPRGLRDQANRPNGTPLMLFLFTLNRKHFPDAYRDNVASAPALGKRLEKG